MYQIIYGSTGRYADVEAFVEQLNQLEQHPHPAARSLFNPAAQVIVARAPGRLDVMGGIADYSGSLVLQLPLREATLVAAQRDPARKITIVSLSDDLDEESSVFSMPLSDFERDGRPIDYASARALFQRVPERGWAAYVAGVLLVLMRERGVEFFAGARLLIQSSVPPGKGISSSAALEVAVMTAVAAAFNISLQPREMALLCQKVENLVVGAPCGIMDQMTAVAGHANQLLALLCQPAEIRGLVSIPPELAVWGIDSGIRHAVSGADYGSVRIGTFMGYKLLMQLANRDFGGYLANVTPSEFEQYYRMRLPRNMAGSDFLEQYGAGLDPVTQIEPTAVYAVRRPTAHPIFEHFRVQAFARLLTGNPIVNGPLLGELMYQSHASYSACGLAAGGTDLLVRLARQVGPDRGIFGAKITGGGSGGTVAVLGLRQAGPIIEEIAEKYRQATGYQPHLFLGSSPGATHFGYLRLSQ